MERAQASHDTAGEQQNEDAQEETAGVNDQDEVTCLNVFCAETLFFLLLLLFLLSS